MAATAVAGDPAAAPCLTKGPLLHFVPTNNDVRVLIWNWTTDKNELYALLASVSLGVRMQCDASLATVAVRRFGGRETLLLRSFSKLLGGFDEGSPCNQLKQQPYALPRASVYFWYFSVGCQRHNPPASHASAAYEFYVVEPSCISTILPTQATGMAQYLHQTQRFGIGRSNRSG